MNEDARAVEITAELRGIKTMADGTFNITFNLPEYCIEQVRFLIGHVKAEVRAVIEIVEDAATGTDL